MATPKLDLAIIGAGIAGLTLAISLQKQPLVNVTLYDKATELKEIGASIALGPNGLRTLERLGLDDAISEEIGFRGPEEVGMIYRHWETNEVIGTDGFKDVKQRKHMTARFHRGDLHGALLGHVPKDTIHLQKKISKVNVDAEKGVEMLFEDGTRATADLLIGADGIRSGVRTHFIPDFPLQWSGWTAFRSVFPISLTTDIPNLPADSTHWWGPQTTFFSSPLGRDQFTIVGGVYLDPLLQTSNSATWDQKADVQLLRDTYADWNPVVKALSKVTPDIRFYPNLSCPSALDSWVFGGRVVLIGDAAHAHGGAHATGGSLAIDDAYTLSLALLSIFPVDATSNPSSAELESALRLYEEVRKPHAERLLGMVLKANEAKLTRLREERVETDQELRTRAARGTDTRWLHEHDVVGAFEAALRSRGGEDAKL